MNQDRRRKGQRALFGLLTLLVMQWTAIVATAIGAVIGVVSTLTADHVRWRRDLSERDRDAMRTSYAQYVEALTQARDEITQTSRDPGLTAEERADSVRTEVFSAT